jgi:excisionase family DNA binding protein
MEMKSGDELLTLKETTKILAISRATLWRILKRGELPFVKVGRRPVRIRRDDLNTYIHSGSRTMGVINKKGALQVESEQERLAESLVQLINLEKKITNITRSKFELSDMAKNDLQDRIKLQLEMASRIVTEFGPNEITIGAGEGFPPRISVSFSWLALSKNRGDSMPGK